MSQLALVEVFKIFQDHGSQVSIITDSSYTFEQGRSYALLGASGSGKSTIIHLLAGIEAPTSGVILYDQTDVATFSEAKRADFFLHTIGLLFQASCLFDEFTVLENVCMKALLAGRFTPEIKKRGLQLLQSVGLEDKKDLYPAQLSGGQQQRVSLLRALLFPPKFLLLDEPTGNLDAQNAQAIITLLLEYQKEYNMGLIISTHDQFVANCMQEVVQVQNQKLIRII